MSELNYLIRNKIDEFSAASATLTALKAGCGSTSSLQFGTNAKITGVDISERQLVNNTQLSEKILGDMQYYVFHPVC